MFVESVHENSATAIVQGIDVAHNQRVSLGFDAVFLGARPINTARILLRSRQLYDRTFVLKESQKFVSTVLRMRGAETAIDHPSITLASVFLETKVPEPDHWVHAQIVPLNQLVLYGSPIPGKSTRIGHRVWSPVLRRLLVASCSMHSDHSSRLELTLRPHNGEGRDRLELNLCPTAEAKAAARTAATALLEKGLRFETIFVPPMTKTANPGSRTHCGASFPMGKQSTGIFETVTLGRPFGWSRIYAVDSSVLPSIPGTTLALTPTANAYRNGCLAPIR